MSLAERRGEEKAGSSRRGQGRPRPVQNCKEGKGYSLARVPLLDHGHEDLPALIVGRGWAPAHRKQTSLLVTRWRKTVEYVGKAESVTEALTDRGGSALRACRLARVRLLSDGESFNMRIVRGVTSAGRSE